MFQQFPLCFDMLGHLDLVIVVWYLDVVVGNACHEALDALELAQLGHLLLEFIVDTYGLLLLLRSAIFGGRHPVASWSDL